MEARAYRTIKDVVFDIIRQTKGLADYETVTKAVLKHFPKSAWKESHWGTTAVRLPVRLGVTGMSFLRR